MHRICDNDNLIDMRKTCNLNDATPYCKKFCFHRCNSNCVMFSFDDRFIIAMDVGYGSDDLIFNASIRYNNY